MDQLRYVQVGQEKRAGFVTSWHQLFCVRILTLMGAVMVSSIGACVGSPNQVGRPGESVVLFLGYGLVDRDTQPFLNELLYGRDKAYGPAASALIRDGKEAADRHLPSKVLRSVTKYDLATDDRGLDKILSHKLKSPADAADRDRLFETFKSVYGVVLIGALEIEAVQAIDNAVGEGQVHNHYGIASVSAILIDFKNDRIAATATGIALDLLPGEDRAQLSTNQRAALLTNAYANAGGRALQSLGLAIKRGRWKPRPMTDTHMVTDVVVHRDADDIARLFDRETYAKPSGSVCTVAPACRRNNGPCHRLTALIAHAMTASLGKAGIDTLPPFHFSQWRADQSNDIVVNFALSQIQNLPAEVSQFQFNFEPRDAGVKVRPIIWRDKFLSEVERTKTVETRSWALDLNYQLVSTDPMDCDKQVQRSGVLPSPPIRAIGESFLSQGAVGRSANSEDIDRMMIFSAIINGFDGPMVQAIELELTR